MQMVRNILLIALALLVQSTLGTRMEIMGARPDFALLMLMLLANRGSTVTSIMYGFFIGFLQDVYSPEFLGANAFAMSLMGFMLGEFRERLAVEHTGVKFVSIVVAILVHDAVYLSFYSRFEFSVAWTLFVRESLADALYTAVFGVVLVVIWQWLERGGFFSVVRELLGD